MKNIQEKLERGINYFGSGSYNSDRFNDFFEEFKESFTYQLKMVNATKIEFSKGHFYISGFFLVGEQWYYFSIPDVRDAYASKMLVRTAKDNKDYTGGQNNYLYIQPAMYKQLKSKFGLEIKTTSNNKKSLNDKRAAIIQKFKDNGYVSARVDSANQACWIGFGIGEVYDKRVSVTQHKLGRCIVRVSCKTEDFNMTYDTTTKRLEARAVNLSEEQLLNSLTLPKTIEYRRNPFSGEG